MRDPSGVAAEATRARLWTAAYDIDTDRVAHLLVEQVGRSGVLDVWDRVCLPLLAALPGRTGVEIAAEHALSEGIRRGLATAVRRPAPAGPGVVLAAAEQEAHCLGLHALAAALGERGVGTLLFGAALPWPAVEDALRRVRPRALVVWAQRPLTGQVHRAVQVARRFPKVRLYVAGPGWPADVPTAIGRLTSLPGAVDACRTA